MVVAPGWRQSHDTTSVRFRDVTEAAGLEFPYVYGTPSRPYVTDSGGSGAAWLDYDTDGRVDIAIANGLPGPSGQPHAATRAALAGTPLRESLAPDGSVASHALFRNLGGRFVDVAAAAGLDDAAWANAVVAADVDNDGFDDVYITAIGPDRLYRNNGDGTFAVWSAGLDDPGWGTGAVFSDWDLDGDLDLYAVRYVDFDAGSTATLGDGVCNYLGIEVFCGPRGLTGQRDVLMMNDDAKFGTLAESAIDPDLGFGFAALAVDCDGTAPAEIYVANDSNMNLLYRFGGGGVEDLSLFSGAGFSGGGLEQAGMGVSASDFDGDGDFDLLVSNFQHDYNTLYENIGDCAFRDVTAERGLAAAAYPYMGWASLFADLDGDGDEDLFVANGHLYPQLEQLDVEPFGQRDLVFLSRLRETGRADFDQLEPPAGAATDAALSSRSAAFADFDNDADLDLLVTHIDRPPRLLENSTAGSAAALRITLIGRQSNRDALGATVRVRSGNVEQWRELRRTDGYLGSNDPRLLIFLPGGVADEVEVRWPFGETWRGQAIAPGAVVLDEQRGLIARRDR